MHLHDAPPGSGTGSLRTPALAAIGAGAVHAVAAGAHGEHRQAALGFTLLAVAQLAWGVAALSRRDRATAATGAGLALAAVAGWVAAKTVGIGAVDGLAGREPVQAADALAAGLALVTLLGCAVRLTPGAGWRPSRLVGALAGVAVLAASVPGMALASQHHHDDGHGDAVELASTGHGRHEEAPDHEGDEGAGHHADVDARPFDPGMPIRLGGMEGVTPEQVAEAEQLVAVTLARLPRYADPAAAEADGFRSIGDGRTGHEHYINWSYIDDEHLFDPDHPESLVYEVEDGQKTLVAAMYMLPRGETLETVPDLGGDLIQWHVHEDLCYTPDPGAHRVGGLVQADGSCAPPLIEGPRVPMIHVWIVPHRCGPFASLEGIAGGRIPDGEERLCDHTHGHG
jgi:hypothetical protein